mgnify:CR=1 FL=1
MRCNQRDEMRLKRKKKSERRKWVLMSLKEVGWKEELIYRKMKRESMRDYKLKQTTNNLPRWLLYCFLLYQMPTQDNKGGFHHTNEVLFDMIKYIV